MTQLILHACSVTQEHYHQWTLWQDDPSLGLEVHPMVTICSSPICPLYTFISELSTPNKKYCMQSGGLGTYCWTHVVSFTTQSTLYSSYSSTRIVHLFGFSQWFFSSGQQQPMRLPYRAKWYLWTSSQVWTVLWVMWPCSHVTIQVWVCHTLQLLCTWDCVVLSVERHLLLCCSRDDTLRLMTSGKTQSLLHSDLNTT